MKILLNNSSLLESIRPFNDLGFVPTMGGIHKGHLSLISKSNKLCKKTIVSIFVNPTQFNDKTDYVKYPRNLNKDIKVLKRLKVDYLFAPKPFDIYKKSNKKIKLYKNDKILCAKFRKGHFEGVLNVMNRLMGLIKAKSIFMGEKDFQQLYLIKKYLSKKYNVKIINCPTVRDKNKVALSTRNKLLNKNNYIKSSLIAKYLYNLKKNLNIRNNSLLSILKKEKKKLENIYKINIDYLEFRNEKNLKLTNSKIKYRLFIAYNIDKIRLIDNF